MSRKYMNDRWCVRCNKCNATPYLRDNLKKLEIDIENDLFDPRVVLDVGCGNGRNSKYMKGLGFPEVFSLDMAGDYGTKCILGVDPIPIEDNYVDIILCNYSIMFLSPEERVSLMSEIKRVANDGCFIMVELYPAKDSYAKNKEEMMTMLSEIFESLGWEKIRYAKAGGKFIARKNT